jgi:hypothetical protein
MILEVLTAYSVLFFRQDTSFQDHCAVWGERGARADGDGGPGTANLASCCYLRGAGSAGGVPGWFRGRGPRVGSWAGSAGGVLGWFCRWGPGGLGGLLEGEAPVEDLGGVLEAGEGAGGWGAEDDADEGAAVADGFEEEGVGGVVGVAGFDAG